MLLMMTEEERGDPMRDGLLEFKDAPMFGRVMRDPDICREVLERLLGLEIERIKYLNAEQVFDPATDAKGVRLDVFAKGSGRVFDIEMQVARRYGLGKRMRYYQALMDQACLGKGEDYLMLAESYIIFICDFDAYGFGRAAYHLDRVCSEEGDVHIGDEAHWLILNASAWREDVDADRARLLEYVHTNEAADDGLIHRIQDAVREANADAGWRESAVGFMTVEQDQRAQMHGARLEGLEQGREEGAQQFGRLVDELLDAGRLDDLKRAADDAAYRESLMTELGLS